jgi:hypothetical protein
VEWQIVGIFHNVRYRYDPGVAPEVDAFRTILIAGGHDRRAQDAGSGVMLKTVASAVHSADPEAALNYLGTLG